MTTNDALKAVDILERTALQLVEEVSRLRNWQQEALPWMNEARIPLLEQIVFWSGRGREEMYRNRLGELDRLIAEAKEAKE